VIGYQAQQNNLTNRMAVVSGLVLWVGLSVVTWATSVVEANNALDDAAAVAAGSPPVLEFYDLVSDLPVSELQMCDTRGPLNEMPDLTALAVKTNSTLSFKVRAFDPDGDSVSVFVGSLQQPLSDFATFSYADDHTSATFEIVPPEGVNNAALCEQVGNISIWAQEETVEQLSVSREIPVFVKCDCPDLEVELFDPPAEGVLHEPIRVSAQILCSGFKSGPFSVSMWLEDPDGRWVASRWSTFESLDPGKIASVPQIMYTPEQSGQYCAYANVIIDHEIVPDNNQTQHCLLVGIGPFVVRPNVATLNGDGINDNIVFRFSNQNFADPRVRIFSLGGDLQIRTVGSYLYVVYEGDDRFRTGTCGVIR